MRILVTGGAGFIGSAFCRTAVNTVGWTVCNLDKLTYSANLASLASIEGKPNYRFVREDICNAESVARLVMDEQPDAVVNFAAETHVDRSITGSAAFVQTNVVGTHSLLSAVLAYWDKLPSNRKRILSLPSRVHRRGVRLAWRRRVLHRDDSL